MSCDSNVNVNGNISVELNRVPQLSRVESYVPLFGDLNACLGATAQ